MSAPARAERPAERHAERLLRWYPRAWRERYGEEFAALLMEEWSERPRCTRRTANVMASGLVARLSDAGLTGGLLDGPAQARASLAALICSLAAFLALGVSMWAQLTIGWQWSAPDSSGTAIAVVAMTGAVLVFAAGASGNVAPIREITGSNTGFSGTTAVALDGAGNMLVADSSGSPSIFVFPATATGNVAPSGSINGSNTGLNEPQCVYVDITGEIYVCNFSNTITVYAAGARGNVAPIRTIAGANTQLSYPNEIRFDAAGNMYVVNFFNNTVAVFPPNANGNQTPLYTLTGPATQLNGAAGITLAP